MNCDALSCSAVSKPARRMRSIFFATAADDLGKNAVLRGYTVSGASFLEMTWTIPSAAGPTPGAIELHASTLDVGAKLLEADSSALRPLVHGRPFEARCVTETERRDRLLDLSGARIAVIFDEGFVEFSGKRMPFHEIELRLIIGDATKLEEFGANLSHVLPIRLLPMSEAEFGLRRMAGCPPAAVKAPAVVLFGNASLDDAIVTILGSCLDQFVANWPALSHSSDPEESIHQMRVSLRRLRAGAGLLRRGAPGPELDEARARAKKIAAALGEARNWDVFSNMLATGPLAGRHKEPSFHALLDAVASHRARAHEKVKALIAAPQTTQFVLDLRTALASRAWRRQSGIDAAPYKTSENPAPGSEAPGSARAFAIHALDRLHRRAMKKSRRLASLPPEKRHKARIALKKSRYAAEFFESVFDDRSAARKYMRTAADIQDSLGAFNDMAMATRLLGEIDGAHSQPTAPASRFVMGWYAHAQKGMAADWRKAEKSLRKLRPFWR